MMKKKYKYAVLMIATILLTGCDFKYEMSITHNTVKENVTMKEDKQENLSNFQNAMDSMLQEYNNTSKGKFDITSKNTSNSLQYTFRYKEKLSTLKDSETLSILKSCYDKVNVLEYENKYLLSTSPEFLCYETYPLLDKGIIDIYTDHIVTYNNADEVKNSHYIWYIDKDNAKERTIQLEFEKNKYDKSSFLVGLRSLLIGGLILLSLLGIGAGYIYIKHKRVNKI